MPDLNDPRWQQLKGGYRIVYDASVSLKAMEAGNAVWDELRQELHHQGDVDEASYAAVPHLVRIASASQTSDWNLYALVGIIEIVRHRVSNPAVPDWLLSEYETAWTRLEELALRDLASCCDPLLIRNALGVVAISKGERKLGALLMNLDTSEIDELAEEKLAWSELYR